jgi:hypothetical protein
MSRHAAEVTSRSDPADLTVAVVAQVDVLRVNSRDLRTTVETDRRSARRQINGVSESRIVSQCESRDLNPDAVKHKNLNPDANE